MFVSDVDMIFDQCPAAKTTAARAWRGSFDQNRPYIITMLLTKPSAWPFQLIILKAYALGALKRINGIVAPHYARCDAAGEV